MNHIHYAFKTSEKGFTHEELAEWKSEQPFVDQGLCDVAIFFPMRFRGQLIAESPVLHIDGRPNQRPLRGDTVFAQWILMAVKLAEDPDVAPEHRAIASRMLNQFRAIR